MNVLPWSGIELITFRSQVQHSIHRATRPSTLAIISASVFVPVHLYVFAGCTQDAETDPCAIDIFTHSLGTISHYEAYNSWRVGDTRLDWMGAQVGQGTYNGQVPSGTPLAWTSNNPLSPAYQELNTLVYKLNKPSYFDF